MQGGHKTWKLSKILNNMEFDNLVKKHREKLGILYKHHGKTLIFFKLYYFSTLRKGSFLKIKSFPNSNYMKIN